ncbi:MAG: VWA domain-containing protein, partial [Planctomycetales bacterium]|nr:VWA domain-containing protein [Planctomycetales bacterium]
MHLGSPISLLGLLLAIPLVALFFLRIKPRRVQVATARMWHILMPQSRPRQWWSKLRDPLFLLLQLLLLALLVGSLVEPQYVDPTHPPLNRVVLLDNSASMAAKTADGTVWADALAATGRMIEHLRSEDRLAIITTARPPRILQGLTSSKQQLKQQLSLARQSAAPSALPQALALADKLVANADHAETWAIGDNQSTKGLSADESRRIQWLTVGKRQDNTAIEQFQVRRMVDDPIGFEVLVRVQHFAELPRDVNLQLTLGGELLDVVPLNLQPNETWQDVLTYTSETGGELVAELTGGDALPLDDRVVGIVPPRDKRQVVLVTSGSYYLERVLRS